MADDSEKQVPETAVAETTIEKPEPAPEAEAPVEAETKPELRTATSATAIARKTTAKKAVKRQTGAKKKPAAKKTTARKAKPVATKTVRKSPAKATAKRAAPTRKSKETTMAKTTKKQDTKSMTQDMTSTFQSAMADMTERTKAMYEKGNSFFADAGGYTKGNMEAAVEASKIFATGMQDLGREVVSESREDFEQFTADVKEMAAVKSPTDFFQLQSAMMRRYFDKAVATGAKNTEAMIKLTNEAAQPIQNRVSIAVDKVRAA